MTRHEYTTNIREELRKLNKQIDYKILRGERYGLESKRHKQLLAQLRAQRKGFIGRLFPVSIFGI